MGSHVDTNKSSGTVADGCRGARAEQCHAIALRCAGDGQAELLPVVLDEEYGHVERRVGMALGLVLRCPDALRDDRATMPDRVVDQPSGPPLPVDDVQMMGTGHWGVLDEECERPLRDGGDNSNGARVLQKAGKVHFCALRSEHLSDVAVDIQVVMMVIHGKQL